MNRGRVVAVWTAVFLLGTAVPADAQGRRNFDCDRCHAELELLRQNVGSLERARSLLTSSQVLSSSAHAPMGCTDCHGGFTTYPHGLEPTSTSSCVDCHAGVDSVYRSSAHAEAGGTGAVHGADCTDCHGVHDVTTVDVLEDTGSVEVVSARCTGCHQTVALAETNPHGGAVACFSCHEPHSVRPPDEPESRLAPPAQPATCGACHDSVATRWSRDVHGRALLSGMGPGADAGAPPSCTSCHGGHDMVAASGLAAVERCSQCHEHARETYIDSYHGQASALGSSVVATCAQCHGAHDIEPATDPSSMVSEARILETCRTCHPDAAEGFALFEPHADHNDREGNPYVYWAYHLMTALLIGVFLVFGAHTAFWLVRQAIDNLRGVPRPATRAGGSPPLDAAQRGDGPFIWRFAAIHRWTHAVMIVSFFLLVITGLPLRFSCTVWAGPLMALLGGVEMAGLLHRIGAVLTFLYFGVHLIFLVVKAARMPEPMKMFWGPDSLAPQPRDVVDFVNQIRWYFGRAPRPRFGRWSYMEKFDYFAVFWGVAIIGGSGLLLWFPEFFARFLPGWLFNVATIVHADEALLAAGFIFTIHFFHVHLRPEKFPLDGVMFTGRATLEYMEEEHPLMEDALRAATTRPVSHKAVHDLPAPPPSRRQTLVATALGFLALGVGVAIIGLILWSVFC